MADEAEAGGSISSAAGGKPTSSTYYAWNQETQKRKEELSRLGVDIAPKPVAAAAASPVTPSAGSAWNAAGTWEERNITSRGVTALKAALGAFTRPIEGGAFVVTVPEPPTVEGSVNLVCVRGKVRAGYELQVTLPVAVKLAADPEGEEVVRGTVTFADVSDTESDIWGALRVSVTSASGPLESGKASAALKGLAGAYRDVFKAWVEACKAM